jgi:hypothetical protein
MGRLVRTSPGSPTRLLVVYSKRRPTAGLKLPVGRHIKQQERRGNQAEDEVGGGSGGLSRAGGEVQFEAQLLVAWQVWGTHSKWLVQSASHSPSLSRKMNHNDCTFIIRG